MKINKTLGIILATTLLVTSCAGTAIADDGILGGISSFITGAVDDASAWVEGAVDDTKEWIEGAANDTANWFVTAGKDTASWVTGAVADTQEAIDSVFISDDVDVSKIVNTQYEAENGELVYFMGEAVNAGTDTGFSESNTITIDDPHFGWPLGTFAVGGFTRVVRDDEECPVFLKTVGDQVSLWFREFQDIECLNGKQSLGIGDDTNGYDEYFGVPKTDFGKGVLIIRYTDYMNNKSQPIIYTDYLAGVEAGADTAVGLFEEGDYEVALNYVIENSHINLGGKFLPSYNDYRIYFEFKVRNGNCMVFPFDVVTGEELTNSAVTENGFYLDLAQSRYLDVNVKKEVLNDTADGLTEDTRFNRPAQDGDQYTSEGIYTITVKNNYTGEETVKKIYVGTNEVLRASAVSGMSVEEIRKQLDQGATIDEDGNLVMPE